MAAVRWVFLVSLCLLLSGCTSPTDGDDERTDGGDEEAGEATATSVARSIDVSFTDCELIEALASVPEAAARRHTPEHFEPVVNGGRVLAVLGSNECKTDNGTMDRAFLAFQVTTDAPDLQAEGRNLFWEPEHLVPNGTGFAASLDDLNVTYTDATLDTEVTMLDATLEAVFGDGQRHTITGSGTTTPPEPGAAYGSFREYFPAAGGYGYFEATYGADVGTYGYSVGTVTTAPGTPTRDAFGAEMAAGLLTGDGFTFEAARIGFMPMT